MPTGKQFWMLEFLDSPASVQPVRHDRKRISLFLLADESIARRKTKSPVILKLRGF
jgi:hypothetical protein